MIMLMIGRDTRRMFDDIVSNSCSIKRALISTARVEFKDGSVITCKRMQDERDLDSIRGMRFDLVLEHSSFSGPYDLLNAVRYLVLRP